MDRSAGPLSAPSVQHHLGEEKPDLPPGILLAVRGVHSVALLRFGVERPDRPWGGVLRIRGADHLAGEPDR